MLKDPKHSVTFCHMADEGETRSIKTMFCVYFLVVIVLQQISHRAKRVTSELEEMNHYDYHQERSSSDLKSHWSGGVTTACSEQEHHDVTRRTMKGKKGLAGVLISRRGQNTRRGVPHHSNV